MTPARVTQLVLEPFLHPFPDWHRALKLTSSKRRKPQPAFPAVGASADRDPTLLAQDPKIPGQRRTVDKQQSG